ncbi:MAG: hypothetical protein J6866_04880, partial [Victivallales bacterium]|nr:hypothetical protein [Victivallales bacterium]
DHPVDEEILRQARQLLADAATQAGVEGQDDVRMLVRLRYAQAAVNFLLALPSGDRQSLDAARKELSRLEESQSRAGEGQRWLQRHMISYYLGRICEALGDIPEAVAAYRRCLENCPRHYWSLQRLHELAPSSLTSQEAALCELLARRPTPVALFQCGLLWCDVAATPAVIQPHDRLKATFYLMVMGEMARAPVLNFQFYDSRGFAFRHRLVFQEDEALTWKIGQMLTVDVRLQPNVSTLSTRQRVLRSGTVFVRATESAVPIPVTQAFDVKYD